MRSKATIHFLTFVLIGTGMLAVPSILFFSPAAAAATAAPSPDFTERPSAHQGTDIDPLARESVDMTKVPPPPPTSFSWTTEYFYRYRRAITLRGGSLYDTKATDGEKLHSLLGIQYLFATRDLKSYEAGADLLSDGTGIAHLARRFIYTRTRFRPYTKVGFGVRIEPADQLATLIRYENYQIRGAGGFEYLFTLAKREINLRFEAEAAASFRSVQGSATLGGVWAW